MRNISWTFVANYYTKYIYTENVKIVIYDTQVVYVFC